MESKAVFEARCKSVGLKEPTIKALKDADIDTMAKLAFICGTQPGSADDKEFVICMKDTLKVDPIPVGTLSALRRLWFESSAMAINEVKSRYEKTDETVPKKMPLPEREHRRQVQQGMYPGIKIEGNLEPSHSLIDFVMSMKDEEVVRYVDPQSCVSREQEVKGSKKETIIRADTSGQLRSVTKDQLPSADISTEYRLRLALQRRSLALDQLNLLPYHESEAYHSYIYDLLMRSVPSSYRPITVSQIMEADKHVWARMSEYCRDGLVVDVAGTYPMERALKKALLDPITVSLLQPLPAHSHSSHSESSGHRQAPYLQSQSGKGSKGGPKGWRSGKGHGKGQKGKARLPEGLEGSSVTSKGKRICFGFNLGSCKDRNCMKGLHVCCKCGSNGHSFQQCPDKN